MYTVYVTASSVPPPRRPVVVLVKKSGAPREGLIVQAREWRRCRRARTPTVRVSQGVYVPLCNFPPFTVDGSSKQKGMACPSSSDHFKLRHTRPNAHQRDGNRGDSSSPPDIWRGCHHPFITLNKEHRQPKQAAAIPIAILSHNIDACKESARIIGSSRREVKPLLTDKPFNITPHNKPSTIQSFANNSDGRYPSPPAFGRGHYAPSPRSTKETVKDPGNSTLFSLRTC